MSMLGGAAVWMLSALAVLPADRLGMADRLFNRGAYGDARAEYAAVRGSEGIAEDAILFRLAECDRMLGNREAARQEYGELLERHPASGHAAASRLNRALAGTREQQLAELPALDSDRVPAATRAIALYHLGTLKRDAALLGRSLKLDPKGRYSSYANFHRAAILAESKRAADRREAVASLLSIAFGGDRTFAEEALYLAAAQSYRERRYGEASSLFHRYLKTYPDSRRLAEVRELAAWSDYFAGKHSDAVSLCGEGKTDGLAYLLGASAQAVGDLAAARKLYAKYLEDYPQGNYRRGVELALSRMDFDTASTSSTNSTKLIENARRAAKLSGSPADAMRLAWAYEKNSQLAEAIAEYQQIARNHPGTAEASEAMYRKALVDLREGRWSAGELALAEALSGDKLAESHRASAIYWRGAASMKLGHDAEGAELLKKALGTGLGLDESREARMMLADWDYRCGRKDEAKSAYVKLVGEGACERMSASRLLSVGKLTGGITAKTCAAVLVRNATPEWRQAGYALLGSVLELEGAYAAAIDAYRQAMAEKTVTESLASAALHLGMLESRDGQLAEAELTLKRAVTLNATNPRRRAEAYLALAKNALEKDDFTAAKGYATVVTTLFDDRQLVEAAAKILKELPEESK